MHPVYLSLGNIHKNVRSKVSRGCWVLLAKIPTPKFSKTHFNTTQTEGEKKGMPGLLRKILFHECLRFALQPLVIQPLDNAPAQTPRLTFDPLGRLRYTYSVVLTWIADLEELLDILGLSRNSCPKCLARYTDLDTWETGIHQPCGHRTGEWILNELTSIRKAYPGSSTWQFAQLARDRGLCGVERVCWEGQWGDICRIASLDELHGIFKGLKDHVIEWLVETVGAERFDAGLMAQPYRVGVRAFTNGIAHISQFSGRENRDLLRHVVGAVVGTETAEPAVLRSLRGILDFTYKSQYPVHSSSTIRAMDADLAIFNRYKYVFIRNGSRTSKRGTPTFRIPKPHNWEHFSSDIEDHGTLDNTSTETSETLHIATCKEPYKASNRKDTDCQILDFLKRHETVQEFSSYVLWRENLNSFTKANLLDGHDVSAPSSDALHGPDIVLPGRKLAKRPHCVVSIHSVAAAYGAPDFISALCRYFVTYGNRGLDQRTRSYYGVSQVPFDLLRLRVWHRFSLELPRPNSYYPFQLAIIHCQPTTKEQRGLFDSVLVEVDADKVEFHRRE